MCGSGNRYWLSESYVIGQFILMRCGMLLDCPILTRNFVYVGEKGRKTWIRVRLRAQCLPYRLGSYRIWWEGSMFSCSWVTLHSRGLQHETMVVLLGLSTQVEPTTGRQLRVDSWGLADWKSTEAKDRIQNYWLEANIWSHLDSNLWPIIQPIHSIKLWFHIV